MNFFHGIRRIFRLTPVPVLLVLSLTLLMTDYALADETAEIKSQIMTLINEARDSQYSDMQVSIRAIDKAVLLANQHNFPLDMAHTRACRAMLYSYLGDHSEALRTIKTAIPILPTLEDTRRKGWILSFVGFVYMRADRPEEALLYYQQSQEVLVTLPGQELQRQHDNLNDMSEIYMAAEQYDQVLRLLLSIEPYWEEPTITNTVSNFFIAESYTKLGQPELGLPYAEQVLTWGQDKKHSFAEAQGNYILGIVKTGIWKKSKNQQVLQEAYNHHISAVEFSNKLPEKRIDHLVKLIGISETQRYLGLKEEARTNLEEALALAIKIKEPSEEMTIRQQIIEMSKQDDPKQALEHAQAINDIARQNYRSTFSTELAQLLIDHDVISKQNHLHRITMEKQALENRQFTVMLAAGFGSLLIILLGGYAWRVITFRARQRQLQQEVAERTQELRASESKYRQLFSETLKEKERTEEALRQERIAIQNNLNFIDMISHEYRTPLTVIDSSLDLIKQGAESPLNAVERMKHSVKKLLHLFETSLSELRVNDDFMIKKTELISLNIFIKLIVDYARRAFPDHMIKANLGQLHDDCRVEIDPDLMNIAFTNIIENACKYSAEEQPVTIAANEYSEGETQFVHIDIIDEGRGIDSSELPNIFEKYYRASSGKTEKGTGVGLFLVNRIVEMHGGTIEVQSQLGRGSKFTIKLPLIYNGQSNETSIKEK